MTTPTEWLLGNDTGDSSMTICAVMTGSEIARPGRPYCDADFGRCYRLLKLFPEWVDRLPEVAQRFPEWGPLVAAWPELTAMYEAILRAREIHGTPSSPPYFRGRPSKKMRAAIEALHAHPASVASKAMYDRISSMHDDCMIAGGWTRVGPGSWRKNGES